MGLDTTDDCQMLSTRITFPVRLLSLNIRKRKKVKSRLKQNSQTDVVLDAISTGTVFRRRRKPSKYFIGCLLALICRLFGQMRSERLPVWFFGKPDSGLKNLENSNRPLYQYCFRSYQLPDSRRLPHRE